MLLIVGSVGIGCAGAPTASDGGDLAYRWLDAYDALLDATFPLYSPALLSVQIRRDLPRFLPEDLEFSFSIGFVRDPAVLRSPPLIARAWSAVEAPAVTQLVELLEASPGLDDAALFRRLRQREWLLTESQCPAIVAAAREFDPEAVVVRLPVPSEIETIVLHPRVVRIHVEGEHRSLTLETTDADDPAFQWAYRAARAVRKCTESVEPATYGCVGTQPPTCPTGH